MQYHLLVMVLAEYSSSYVLSVCLSYGVGNLYFDLAQTQQYFQTIVQLSNILCSSATFPNHCAAQQHFQTIVQLAHTHPTMSCIHLAQNVPLRTLLQSTENEAIYYKGWGVFSNHKMNKCFHCSESPVHSGTYE